MRNKAMAITKEEWWEIMDAPIVKERFNIGMQTPDEFVKCVYGAKFISDGGYPLEHDGEFYIIHNNLLAGESPLVLYRNGDRELTELKILG